MQVYKYVKDELEEYKKKGYTVIPMPNKSNQEVTTLAEKYKSKYYVDPGYIINTENKKILFILVKERRR